MSDHVLVHSPVGGKLLTFPFKILMSVAGIGAIVALYRFTMGIGHVSALNDGYPWGIWIAIDVVLGTAIGCGGYAVALLVYILNRGKYHPLVRPAILTSLLGYGFAVLAVTIDLGRFWGLWKIPIFYWRWTHSPQLEVALCVAAYNLVLLLELSPALFEKWRSSSSPSLRAWADRGLRFVDRGLIWIIPLGLLLRRCTNRRWER
jgi:Ni/Fe-hydrogenase subunit HybB-like protein